MMKLYYTTVKEPDSPNSRPDLSLGGYKSSTPIPNASNSNLFSDVSIYSVYSDKEEYIGIAVKNESSSKLENVNLWFNVPEDSQIEVEVAATIPNESGMVETIPNTFSRPMYSEFFSANSEEDKVGVGDIEAGEFIFLWLMKKINIDKVNEHEEDEVIISNPKRKEANEDIKLIFEWE